MNYQMPYGMPNQNLNMAPHQMPNMMPQFPSKGMPNLEGDDQISLLEKKVQSLESRISRLEKKLNLSSDNDDGNYPYLSSMHMM